MPCNKQCHECAFLPGSEANMEIGNRLRGKLAMLGPFPFHCHDNESWRNAVTRNPKSRRELRESDYEVCGGWTKAVQELAKTGYYKESPVMTKAFAQAAYQLLNDFLSTDDPEYKAEVMESMKRILKQLGKKYKSFTGHTVALRAALLYGKETLLQANLA